MNFGLSVGTLSSVDSKAHNKMPFKLVNSLKVNNEIPVSKFQSTDTDLLVYIAEVESPVTSAYVALGKKLSICFQLCKVTNESSSNSN